MKEYKECDDNFGAIRAEIEERQSAYQVPESIQAEVSNYLQRMKDPELGKEEYLTLLAWAKDKKENDPNYQLAFLEQTLREDSYANPTDPENPVHKLNLLRERLSSRE